MPNCPKISREQCGKKLLVTIEYFGQKTFQVLEFDATWTSKFKILTSYFLLSVMMLLAVMMLRVIGKPNLC